jgi:DNA-binding NarL/FixJ family response regulator
MKNIKIIIADDHKMLRKAWNLLISQIPNVTIIGEASNGAEVLELLSKNHANIVLMDVDMPLMDGFETARIIKEKYPWSKIIVLTMLNDNLSVKKLLKVGIAGYVTKNSSNEELIQAIQIVEGGGKYLCSEVQNILLDKVSDHEVEKLTNREKEIIKHISDGLSSREISEKLFLSIKTIESHRGNIYKKLKVKNVAELISFANNSFMM